MPNRVETRSARVKILLSHSIDEAGAEHTAVGQLHISTTMNQLRMLQEIYLKMHPLLEMPSGIKFATFYCKRPET